MLFGNLWDEEEAYPPSLDINFFLKKGRFFLGDRWIDIGKVESITERTSKGLIFHVNMPQIEEFFEKREYLDDGTFDWYEWGPRVN